jgi:parallel beta-helix repeat protein
MNIYSKTIIAIIALGMLIESAGAVPEEPPNASLNINGTEQISGIGSYCWSESGLGACADMIGIITPKEPLPASSHFTAHLSLPLREPPQELHFNIIQAADYDELKLAINGSRAWRLKESKIKEGNYSTLPLLLERESDINLSLEPGLYVLNVFAGWKNKGDVTYGFLIEVHDNGTGTKTLTVDKSGGANYTKIQDAINNASNGDAILVYSGTYYEYVDVNKQLILRGIDDGSGMPVVDVHGYENGTVSRSAITLSANGIVLEGFKAINLGNGILLNFSNNSILSGNIASNNKYGYGIFLQYSRNNTLIGNIANSNLDGIQLEYSNNNTLTGNTANSNQNGIVLVVSNNNTLSNSSINSNIYGIYLGDSSNNMLSGNTANSDSQYGISLISSSNNTIYNNFFSNTINFRIENSVNKWNITKTNATNIIGGMYLGGNVWASPDGEGFSQTCEDSNHDGICDSSYTLERGKIDYQPLAYKTTKIAGFEAALAIATISAVYAFGRKRR